MIVKTKAREAKSSKPLAQGVGRRKTAVARIWVRRGTGALIVNGRKYAEYFDTDVNRQEATTLFRVVPVASNYDIEANVNGGGLCAQAGAIKVGIARALVSIDEDIRPVLREHSLLTMDSRRKERKKYGQKAARRGFQFVKR
jgi:small subunit ribosomal protein S9